MSDDDYYAAGSPYDDLEDLLWDAEEPDIAGDLAEHTLHSPVYQDDPAWEIMGGYSDWEYYSDDYYDDDPVLLRKNPQDGSPLANPTARTGEPPNRGRKRKLAETKDIPPLDLDERKALVDCVRGTVWARPHREGDPSYQEGQGEKVALLKDWKKVFREAQDNSEDSGRTFGRGQLRRDESWAKDMSLADMGLTSAKGREASTAVQANGEATYAEDEEDEEDEEEVEEVEEGEEDGAGLDYVEMGKVNGARILDPIDEGEEEETPLRKRQKQMLPPSPLSKEWSRLELNESLSVVDEDVGSGKGNPPKRPRGRPKKQKEVDITPDTRDGETTHPVRGRKRRASASGDEEENRGVNQSSIQPRSKRVASSKLATAKEEEPPASPAARVTRGRKR